MRYLRLNLASLLSAALVFGTATQEATAKTNNKVICTELHGEVHQSGTRTDARVDVPRPPEPLRGGSQTVLVRTYTALLAPTGTSSIVCTGTIDNQAPASWTSSASAGSAAQAFSPAPVGKAWFGFERTIDVPQGAGTLGGRIQFTFNVPPPGLEVGDVFGTYTGAEGLPQQDVCMITFSPGFPVLTPLFALLLAAGMLGLLLLRRGRLRPTKA